MLDSKMALLVLLWQEACLEHTEEKDELLPGSRTATVQEEKVLDAVKEKEAPELDWDDFNKAYMSFATARERLEGCTKVLAQTGYDFRLRTIAYLKQMASASFEDKDTPISDEEQKFIEFVEKNLGIQA